MKIATLHRVHDGEEWLEKSLKSIALADHHLAVCNIVSKAGAVYYKGFDQAVQLGMDVKICERNELDQRIYGIQLAQTLGCTHYTAIDCDEVYDDYGIVLETAKKHPDKVVLVPCKTYFQTMSNKMGKELFCIDGWDRTLIAAVCPIECVPSYRNYDYYKGRVDPTRAAVASGGYVFAPTFVHHYSWVRKDMESLQRKMKGSTASVNIFKSGITNYLTTAKAGDVLPIFGKKIVHEQDWRPGEKEELCI